MWAASAWLILQDEEEGSGSTVERGGVTAATLTNQQLERRWYLTGRPHVEERNLMK